MLVKKNEINDYTLYKEFAELPVLQIDQFQMDNQDQLGFQLTWTPNFAYHLI